MTHLLATTALILTLGVGVAFAQDTTTDQVGETNGSTVGTPANEGAKPNQPGDAIPTDEKQAVDAEASDPNSASAPIVRKQGPNELRVDWITGTTVTSPSGETIGDINDLIVDRDTGEMKAAILSVGGFLGFGSKQIAVDWSELQIDYDASEVSLNLRREEADNAPDYDFRERAQRPRETPVDSGAGGMGTGGIGSAGGMNNTGGGQRN